MGTLNAERPFGSLCSPQATREEAEPAETAVAEEATEVCAGTETDATAGSGRTSMSARRAQYVGRRAAAAAYDRGTGIHDRFHGLGKFVRAHVEDGLAILNAGQARVGLRHDEGAVVRRELPHERRQLRRPEQSS